MPLNNPSVSKPIQSNLAKPFLIPSSNTPVGLLANNFLRRGATIYNNSEVDLYIELGEDVSLTNFTVKLNPDGYYEIPFGYTGDISGIWSSVDGNALVREFT